MRRALVALGVTAALTAGVGAAAYGLGTTTAQDMHDRMTSMPMSSMPMSSMPMSSMPMGSMHTGSMHTGSMPMGGVDMDAMHAQMRAAMPAEPAGPAPG
jgi:hypothetical protein